MESRNNEGNSINQGQQFVPQVVKPLIPKEIVRNLQVVLVNRNKKDDEIVRK